LLDGSRLLLKESLDVIRRLLERGPINRGRRRGLNFGEISGHWIGGKNN
jgi:hypothetical protein